MAKDKVTTSFEVDISELKKEFQEAQRVIKSANAEFANSTSGLTSWQKSATGLEAKLKQLYTVRDAEKTQLKNLEAQYDKVVESLGENSKEAQDLNIRIVEQEAKIGKTNTQIKKYRNSLKDMADAGEETGKSFATVESIADDVADGIKKFGTSVNDFMKDSIQGGISTIADGIKTASSKGLEAIEGLAKGIAIGLTGAVATGVASIVKIGSSCKEAYEEVYEGTENLLLATGATKDDAKALEESYKSVASTINADFSSVGSAMGEVNTRFGYTGEQLEECTTQFLKFAEITGTDATSSVQLVSRAMGDAGIDADDYAEVLDELAVACQGSGISLDSLATNLTKYGAPMRALGFDTQESIAIFSSWEKAGVNTETAFSGMKKAISNWASAGKDSREEFKKTLEEIANCPSIAEATTKAIEVFGTKAGPDLADAIQGGRFEYEDFLELLEGSSGTVTNTFDEIQTGTDKFETATNRLKVQGSEVGEVLIDVGGNLASSLLGNLSDIIDKVLEHKDTIKAVVDGTIKPKLEEFSKKVTEISKSIGEKIPDIIDKFIKFKDAIKDAIENNVKPMLRSLDHKAAEVLPTVVTAFGNFQDKIIELKDNVVNAVQTYIVPILSQVQDSAVQVFEHLKTAVQGSKDEVSSFGETLKSIAETVLPVARDILIGLVGVLGDIVTWIIDHKDGILSALTAIGVGFLAFNVVTTIQGVITALSALPTVLTVVQGAMAGLNAVMSANPIGIVIALVVALIAYFVSLYNTSAEFRDGCDILWAKIKEVAGNVWAKVKEIWDFFMGFGEYLYDWIHITIPNNLGELLGNISNFKDRVVSFFSELPDKITDTGRNMVEGLWNGINDKFGWITGKISEFTNGVLDGIKDFFGIHSPSKVFETDIGYNLVYGLANGITKKTSTAVKSMTELAKATVSPFDSLQTNVGIAKNSLSSGVSSSGSNALPQSGGTTLNFYQTNTSPKSLSRLEIYRQTKNQLNYAKAVI